METQTGHAHLCGECWTDQLAATSYNVLRIKTFQIQKQTKFFVPVFDLFPKKQLKSSRRHRSHPSSSRSPPSLLKGLHVPPLYSFFSLPSMYVVLNEIFLL
ncbi:hypothetical protein CEXT_75881 [Caerostris extrusa]|uniref:Uncharacterized protein n=1 Tax=Caerostris extrusa TaxID=172846 RepID=A0AAV4WUZ7_CAEEX|nr:hypothetical protein CEXT_75881 [Caerostris extrusa]